MPSLLANARENAGLPLEVAAKRAGCSTDYLRRIENCRGTCSYPLAQRLARLYGCSLNLFLTKQGQSDARRNNQTERKQNAS